MADAGAEKVEKHVHMDPSLKKEDEKQTEKHHRKNILIAVDGSHASNKGLDWYLEEHHNKENFIILMHCFELPLMHSYQDMYLAPEMWTSTLKKEADRTAQMEKIFMKKLKLKGLKGKFIARGGGKPGESILAAAEEDDVDLIVMGTRGHGRLMRALLGSVSHYVMSHAHCPVMVYREKNKHKKDHKKDDEVEEVAHEVSHEELKTD